MTPDPSTDFTSPLVRWLRGMWRGPLPLRRGGYNTGPGSVEAVNRYRHRVNAKARRRKANKAARAARRVTRASR